ncbi:Domain of unknown function DUF4485 [Cinara cedri]|uniref:DUF4485 domain-containing protein n=1 Tax=Cinara cedri TaxID=506608 RepID=A0A5E4MDB0_9HEMI|nr:Domain of unknown function DUF4485 [Cinara cedri]
MSLENGELDDYTCVYTVIADDQWSNRSYKPKNNALAGMAWIAKLTEDPHPTRVTAIKRNMYLAQLIINLTDRKLAKPFMKMPTSESLENYENIEYSREPKRQNKMEKTHEIFNREISLDELNHISSDERTYIAIQSIENGSTLFGYVAVSFGHSASPLWVNAQGETIKSPAPKLQNLPVSSAGSQGFDINLDDQATDGLNSLVNEVWDMLSRRKILEIREHTGEFYRMLYNTVEQEMLVDELSSGCRDPYVEKLIIFLTEKLLSENIRNPLAFRRINLLSALKKRIKAVINEIEDRRNMIEEVKKTVGMTTIQLKNRANCPSFASVITLQEALEGTMNKKSIDILKMQFTPNEIDMFKLVIINEKKRLLMLLKNKLDNVTGEMYQDIKDTIMQGLRSYQLARKEWERVSHVLKEYDEIEKLIFVNRAIAENDGEDSDNKFLKAITKEIDLAQKRLKNAIIKTDKEEKDISKLHTVIHELHVKYEFEKMVAEKLNQILKEEINNEKMELAEREATIQSLENERLRIDPNFK